jgi:peptidoglycan/LPS O-acetylase OafA/YrhL
MAMARRLVTPRGHRLFRAARPGTVQPSSGSRMPGIEGLRAIAPGSVLVYHCWLFASPDRIPPQLGSLTWVMPHLRLGVILFFSLSGFLLYRPFAAAVVRGVHGPGVRTYLRNRALRILPACWVILLVTSVALGAALLRDASSALVVGSTVGQPLTLLKDVALVQSYDPWTLLTGIGPAWSLVIEVAFYVTLPLVAALAAVVAGGSNRTGIGDAKYDLLMAIPCGVLLAIVVLPDAGSHRLISLLDSRPLAAVGLASYSLFLWHEPLVHWPARARFTFNGAGALSSTSLCSGRSLGWRPH